MKTAGAETLDETQPITFTNFGPTSVVIIPAGEVRPVFTNVGPPGCDLHVWFVGRMLKTSWRLK